MKFSIGDIVLLKRTGAEAVVTGYIHPQLFEVESGGIVFPVHADDMEHPYLKWFTDKKKTEKKNAPPEQLPVEKEKFPVVRMARGVYLSFLPVYRMQEMEDVVELLKIYLLNELPYPVRYRYEVKKGGSVMFFHEGVLQAFQHVYLHHIPYEDMNDQPRFHWLLADADSSKGLKEASDVLRIRPSRLFERIMELQANNEPMFSYLLADIFIQDIPEKKHPVSKRPAVAAREPALAGAFRDLPRYEVDLHIEQLIQDTRGMSNAEILQVQMAYLHRYLRLAIAHRFERMIVIHGVGRGVLRDAVHDMLRDTPEVGRFVHEWLGKYGFGATEVHFSY